MSNVPPDHDPTAPDEGQRIVLPGNDGSKPPPAANESRPPPATNESRPPPAASESAPPPVAATSASQPPPAGNESAPPPADAPSEAAQKAAVVLDPSKLNLALPQFEGPLDLLLNLIQEHKLDIFDIPIAFVTDRYLEYVEKARELNIDLAGEYLVMASTLVHLKSRMLLPREQAKDAPDNLEPGPDPREELVRRLLEYQKYKHGALQLGALPMLGRDTFVRRAKEELPLHPDEVTWLKSPELSVYRLIELFDKQMKARKIEIPHEVFVERLSIGDRISTITDRLKVELRIAFSTLFADLQAAREKHRVVPTFLAVLEMTKLKLIRVHQPDPHGEIWISRTDALLAGAPEGVSVDYRD
ncbi:MAG: segregation/condensation protein A [Deltaproteobacteria bacterium]|nr:segregation/condensation protein A [Deltaproteobacteria bacterium]